MADLYFLKKLGNIFEVPFFLLEPDGKTTYFPAVFEGACPVETDPALLKKILRQSEPREEPFIFLDDNIFYFACMKDRENTLYCFGPFARKSYQNTELHAFATSHGMMSPPSIPVRGLSGAAEFLSFVYYFAEGKELSHDDIPLYGSSAEEVYLSWNPERDLEYYQLAESEEERSHAGAAFEKKMLAFVREGDIDGMQGLMRAAEVSTDQVGNVAKTDFKRTEYLMVSLITLLTRAAIDGGLSEEEAYQLGDVYMQRISACSRPDQITMIGLRAQYEFTERVARSGNGDERHLLVERCKNYIAKNLRKDLKVEDIGPAIGFSRTYLSRKFSEYEGQTIQQYIMEERCRHAANLLRYSDYPISLIAEYFCFSSQSHFGRHFKALFKMTPREWREKYQSAGEF